MKILYLLNSLDEYDMSFTSYTYVIDQAWSMMEGYETLVVIVAGFLVIVCPVPKLRFKQVN